jgi:hypothetical protein
VLLLPVLSACFQDAAGGGCAKGRTGQRGRLLREAGAFGEIFMCDAVFLCDLA